ncbi:cold shock domain-containing protein [Hahella aquimaris]|uniref:cold-shock protein n=1 Tax=Hahella sp. HNIBRBA332 TaxID=3015983 RepID=UPI00273A9644|nr:cold shock domain-containing protein [Hahella sp. HNIBRBA332]WLQ15368.1 cold shock domain-containing protein [Hahella sp. HNIBRBA332]
MPQGKVKWFNNAKGYGFIIADEGNGDLCKEDLFVHFSSIQMEGYKTLKAGQAVNFDAQPSGKGFHAVNIVPLESEPEKSSIDPETETAEGPESAAKAESVENKSKENSRTPMAASA